MGGRKRARRLVRKEGGVEGKRGASNREIKGPGGHLPTQ
jgi:hypothetical protein